jgi:hypothetical protein
MQKIFRTFADHQSLEIISKDNSKELLNPEDLILNASVAKIHTHGINFIWRSENSKLLEYQFESQESENYLRLIKANYALSSFVTHSHTKYVQDFVIYNASEDENLGSMFISGLIKPDRSYDNYYVSFILKPQFTFEKDFVSNVLTSSINYFKVIKSLNTKTCNLFFSIPVNMILEKPTDSFCDSDIENWSDFLSRICTDLHMKKINEDPIKHFLTNDYVDVFNISM